MVEVFKTDVTQADLAERLRAELNEHLPAARINFDLEDCDHILRVEVDAPQAVIFVQRHLQQHGFSCEALD